MLFLQTSWLIPLLPLLACALISFTPIRRSPLVSGWLAIGSLALATVWAIGLLAMIAGGWLLGPNGELINRAALSAQLEGAFFPPPNVVHRVLWAPTGESAFAMGIYVDPLVAVMLAMVTLIGTCIQLFSLGYLHGDARQARFFSFTSLFTAAMVLMCMADNLLLFFMAWEVMGLCSYLLIGFYFQRPQAYRAALKAFMVTRVGDVLMMLGLVYLYTQTGSLSFGYGAGELFNTAVLEELATTPALFGLSAAGAIALLLFCGTIGKAAQFPLHTWLPDAMEGPTPVSALIHAATMVAAGVFLVARTYPIFVADGGTALMVVAFVGAFTAFFAATIAIAQFDIKRILAYSTISQLGFMVAALGVGGWLAALFHLLMHAFFKALLFLGSGSIIHAIEHTRAIEEIHARDAYAAQQTAQDIRNMGGLGALMPWTFWTYTAGYLALVGIVPFAGFWSKDEILADAVSHGSWLVFAVLLVTAFLTALYMTRQWRAVFFGSFRGATPRIFVNPEPLSQLAHDHPDESHAPEQPRENDWMLIAPLVLLASFAVVGGLFNLPTLFPGMPFAHWLADVLVYEAPPINWLVASISMLVAGAGIALGWNYAGAFTSAQDDDSLERRAPGLFRLLHNKYRIDEAYSLVLGTIGLALTALAGWLDRAILTPLVAVVGRITLFLGRLNFIVDDTLFNDGPDNLARGTNASGRRTRRLQTGKAQDYLAYLVGGVVLLAALYLYVIR
jgi:NADH-quinone oxidoreductase subunit L